MNGLSLRVGLLWAIAVAAMTWPVLAAEQAAPVVGSRNATLLEINGAIGPATSHYIVHELTKAESNGSALVILQMDTPGGLDTSMRDIIRAILAARIPVVSYVAPSGARAASAGTYILYASHVAAMAPATNLGAATPVSIGGEEPRSAPESPGPENPKPAAAPEDPTSGPAENAKHTASAGKSADAGKSGDTGKSGDASNDARKSGATGKSGDTGKAGDSGKSGDSGKAGDAAEKASEPRAPSPQLTTAMERKVVNDAVAYIRGLAELRGRNADWAESAVRGAASLSATAALRQKVIEIIAPDVPDLLAQLDGREVRLPQGLTKLQTQHLPVVHVEPDWRTRFLAVITNPTIAYGLMLIGIYGLLLEGYNPGVVLPGVVGVISLLLALFAFQILSVNYAGLALVAVGIGLIVMEFFLPTFGSLGLGGLIAFIVGSLILFDTDVPGMNIGLPLIGAIATIGGLLVIAIAWLAARSRGHRVVTGMQGMLGESAQVVTGFDGKGTVRYGGELWNARSRLPLQAGQAVKIAKVDGLTVWVEPL